MSVVPQLVSQYDYLLKRNQDNIQLLENYVSILTERAEAEEKYSQILVKLNSSFNPPTDLESQFTSSLLNTAKQINQFHSDNSLVLMGALKGEVLMAKDLLQTQSKSLTKFQDEIKASEKELRNSSEQLEKTQEQYFKASKELQDTATYQQSLDSNPDASNQKSNKNRLKLKEISKEKSDLEAQYQVQTSSYNVALQFFIENTTQINEQIIQDQTERMQLLQNSIFRQLTVESNTSSNNNRESNTLKQQIQPLEIKLNPLKNNQSSYIKEYSFSTQSVTLFSSFLVENPEKQGAENDPNKANINNKELAETESNSCKQEVRDCIFQVSRQAVSIYLESQLQYQKAVNLSVSNSNKADEKLNAPVVEVPKNQPVVISEQKKNEVIEESSPSVIQPAQDSENQQDQSNLSLEEQQKRLKMRRQSRLQDLQENVEKISQMEESSKEQSSNETNSQTETSSKSVNNDEIAKPVITDSATTTVTSINKQTDSLLEDRNKILALIDEVIEVNIKSIENHFDLNILNQIQFLIKYVSTCGGGGLMKVGGDMDDFNNYNALITRQLYRDCTLTILESFRLQKKFEFTQIEYDNLTGMMMALLDISDIQFDSQNIKQIMMTSFSLYKVQNLSKKFFYEIVKEHKVWSKYNLWESFLVASINEDSNKHSQSQMGPSGVEQNLLFKNMVHCHILSVGLNMCQFHLSKSDIQSIINQYSDQYGLPEVQVKQLLGITEMTFDTNLLKIQTKTQFPRLNQLVENK